MNLGELKIALKRYGFDDDDPLETWLNAAMWDFCKGVDWPWGLHVEGINVAAYDGVMAPFAELPETLRKVNLVYDFTNNKPLEYTTKQDFAAFSDSTGEPQYFTLYQEFSPWRIYPYPFNTEVLQLEVEYFGMPSRMVSDGDVPGIPEWNHYSIVRGAAAVGLEAENEETRAQTALSAFEKDIEKAKLDADKPQAGNTMQVVDTQGYFSDI